jgi:diamine N-acetyltransferase
MITLREISQDNLSDILALQVSAEQQAFVASNAKSLAQALFYKQAWYRAIYNDAQPVGFVMLADDGLLVPVPDEPTIGIWRIMIDQHHQGKGFGRAALQLAIDHVIALKQRTGLPYRALELSFVPENQGAEALYLALGFQRTGRIDEGEIVMALPLK